MKMATGVGREYAITIGIPCTWLAMHWVTDIYRWARGCGYMVGHWVSWLGFGFTGPAICVTDNGEYLRKSLPGSETHSSLEHGFEGYKLHVFYIIVGKKIV